MGKQVIYLGRTDKVRPNDFVEAREYLESIAHEDTTLLYHIINDKYDPRLLEKAHLYVLLIGSQSNNTIIGKGVYEQIKKIQAHGLSVVLMYKRRYDETFNFYIFGGMAVDRSVYSQDYSDYGEVQFGGHSPHTKHYIQTGYYSDMIPISPEFWAIESSEPEPLKTRIVDTVKIGYNYSEETGKLVEIVKRRPFIRHRV